MFRPAAHCRFVLRRSVMLRLCRSACVLVVLSLPALAQVPATIADQMTTDEHLAKPGWWPRKSDTARSDYVGAAVCAECHAALAQGQQQHAMAHSSMPVSEAEGLKKPISYDIGPFHYSIVRKNGTATYTVTNGNQSFSAPILWAFGSGKHGQSFLFDKNGDLYEAHVSYYRSLGVGVTPDHPTGIPASLDDALGRKIDKDEAPKCLGCHSTAAVTSGRLNPGQMIFGVTCEACHGPGAAHVALARAGNASPGMIANPGRLDPVTSVDFCGSCHRTWWDIDELGYHGLRNVRFAVYRLQTSRCWGKGDARITCVACHDPHKPLVTDISAYDEKCLSCHVKSASVATTADHPGRGCPVSAGNCASCHMPTYQLPQMNNPFTDHQIRIVRDTKTFPDE